MENWSIFSFTFRYLVDLDKSLLAESDHSGVETATPRKSLNPETTIFGIGVVHTYWVGQKGGDEIQKLVGENTSQPLIKSLQSELSRLSKEIAGVLKSTNEEVQSAITLCQKYTSKPSRRSLTNDRLHNLWSTNQQFK